MGQRGQALIEAIVATAIVAILLGAALSAIAAANAHFGPDPARAAMDAALQRELRAARNLLKYEGATLEPAAIATSLPLPSGSPLPATLSLQTAALPDGAVEVVVTVVAANGPATVRRSLSATFPPPVPVPGSTVVLPTLVPAPTGAP